MGKGRGGKGVGPGVVASGARLCKYVMEIIAKVPHLRWSDKALTGTIVFRFTSESLTVTPLIQTHLIIMAKTGKTVATLLIGTAVGVALGYMLATDKEARRDNMDRIKDRWGSLRNRVSDRFSGQAEDLEEEIYNA